MNHVTRKEIASSNLTHIFIPSKAIIFSGNRAEYGGDVLFGGCLSNCLVYVNKTQVTINKNDPQNIFWDLVSFGRVESQSTLVEYPKRVSFCTNTSLSPTGDAWDKMCSDSHVISAYRGEMFNVALMVTDDFCFPSVKLIQAYLHQEDFYLDHDIYQESRKYCFNFSYAITARSEHNTTTIEFSLQEHLFSNISHALLTVHLRDCPIGFVVKSGRCYCQVILKSYKIECSLEDYSLEIPARTWVGSVRERSESIACQYCNSERKATMKRFTKEDSVYLQPNWDNVWSLY